MTLTPRVWAGPKSSPLQTMPGVFWCLSLLHPHSTWQTRSHYKRLKTSIATFVKVTLMVRGRACRQRQSLCTHDILYVPSPEHTFNYTFFESSPSPAHSIMRSLDLAPSVYRSISRTQKYVCHHSGYSKACVLGERMNGQSINQSRSDLTVM